jgi:hydrazine synthase alpha subunit-like protein
VPGGAQTVGKPGKIYDITDMQLFQADQIRGYANIHGRRVLAQPMHDPSAQNPSRPGGPPSSVALGLDGSMAAFVPARRAMTWQLTDPTGAPVVRERNWVSFAPGEIRACPSCHGLNTQDQTGHPVPQNEPQALKALLLAWKTTH